MFTNPTIGKGLKRHIEDIADDSLSSTSIISSSDIDNSGNESSATECVICKQR